MADTPKWTLKDAIDCYQKALAIFRESGDRYSEGLTLINFGLVYENLRQRGQAAICWRDAAAAMRDVGDYKEAASLERMIANVSARRRRG